MHKQLTWSEKYILSISEYLSIKQIMALREIGQPSASKIRKRAVAYCVENGIEFTTRLIPTEAVLAVTGRDSEYYFQKMLQESRLE